MEAVEVYSRLDERSMVRCSNCIYVSAGPYGLHCTEWEEHVEDESVAEECDAFTPIAVRVSGMEEAMAKPVRGYSRVIDGIPVDKNLGRVSGRFEITDHDAAAMLFDDEIMIVLMGRVSAPTYADGKGGEIHRVNIIKPREARLIRGEDEIIKMLEKLGFDQRLQPSLFDQAEEPTEEDEPLVTFDDPDAEVWEVLGELDDEIDVAPVEDFTVEGEPEPEPTYSGNSEDEEDDAWSPEDEEAALKAFLEEEPPRVPRKDEAGHAALQRVLHSSEWD